MFEQTDSDGICNFTYDSVTEWYEDTTLPWIGWMGSNYRTPQTAYKAAIDGNGEYVEKIKAVTSKLTGMIQASMPDLQHSMDVTGLGYDVGLALSGVPECWLTMTPSKEPKVVRILYNATVSSGISQSQIIARGVGIAALINCLEVAGIATEVVLMVGLKPYSATVRKEGVRGYVTFKKAGDYFDLEKFSFGICDPSFFRMLGFSWVRSKTKISDTSDSLPLLLDRKEEGYDMYFGRAYLYDNAFRTLETTKDWVIEKCREFGVEISNPPLA